MHKKVIFGMVSTLVAAAIAPFMAIGISNADALSNTSSSNTSVSVAVWRSEKLEAIAQVLNTSTSNVQAAMKDKTLDTLVAKAGFSKTTFREAVKAQLTNDLEAMGYSQSEVMSHTTMAHTGHYYTRQ